MQATRTKAVADTFNIEDEHLRNETIKHVNTMGRHLMNDLRVPKGSDNQLFYLKAVVAVSPP